MFLSCFFVFQVKGIDYLKKGRVFFEPFGEVCLSCCIEMQHVTAIQRVRGEADCGGRLEIGRS
jgi:hypothetical protein